MHNSHLRSTTAAMSNLSFTIRLPIAKEAAERMLAQPFTLPSLSLRQHLDDLLLPLCTLSTEDLRYFGDASWIDAHLAYFCQLSRWEVLALISRTIGTLSSLHWVARESSATGPAGYFRRGGGISHIAFIYAEVAIAESLSPALPEKLAGLLHIDGPSRATLNLLFKTDGFNLVPEVYWHDRHPLHEWLAQYPSPDHDSPWPAWAHQLAVAHATVDRWLAFATVQRRLSIERASPAHPVLLGECHSSDGKHVFFGNVGSDDARQLEGCDPYTFREIEDGEGVGNYGADADSLWSWGNKLPCKNPQAFGPLKENPFFFTDGHHIYSDDEVLPDVLASEIRPVDGDEWQRGFLWQNRFYTRYGGWNWFAVEGGNLRAISYDYVADAADVCLLEQGELHIIENYDPATAHVVETDEHRYLCDAKRVGCIRSNNAQPKLLRNARGETFRHIPHLPFVTDGTRVWQGERVCKDLDANQLCAVPAHIDADEEDSFRYFRCGDAIGHIDGDQYQWLAEADAATFEMLSERLARDRQHIWHSGEIVAGACATGFVWQNKFWRWSDGQHHYEHNQIIPDDTLDLNWGMIFRQGQYFFDGIPVAGWTSGTHPVNAFGCIEDAFHYYTWGKGLHAWGKSWCAEPDNHFQRNDAGTSWLLAPLEPLPWPASLLSDEEFETLLESVPQSMSHGMRTTWQDPPLSIVRQTEPFMSIKIETPIQCSVYRDACNNQLVTTLSPHSRNMLAQARRHVERLLATVPPASSRMLDELVNRLSASESQAEFDTTDGSLQIQDGRDNLRGAWLSLRNGEQDMRQMAIWMEGEFLDACNLSGPITLWNEATSDDRFVREPWTAELRQLWRTSIKDFLDDMPALRQQPNTHGRKKALTKQEITMLCKLLAPALSAKTRNAMVTALNEAQSAPADPDLADNKHGKPGAQLWEALLNQLEDHGLLHGFAKQQPLDALPACNALARCAGINVTYTPGDDCGGDSFMDIANDFDRWLSAHSHTLLWPQGSLQWDDDEIFPAVIVRISNCDDIDRLVGALGKHPRFVRAA